MTTMLFDDDIISSTELKNNQKRWFDRALKSPVSITNRGGRQLVLINRQQIHDLVAARDYAEEIFEYCHEIQNESETGHFESNAFPWAVSLASQDRIALRDELVSLFNRAVHSNSWNLLDEALDAWKATAEALADKEFMAVVNSTPEKREYTAIE
jgi:hypothetical protein